MASAVYESEWLDGDVQFRKAMLLMMIRAKYPQKLVGLKFTTASLQGLGKVSGLDFWSVKNNLINCRL